MKKVALRLMECKSQKCQKINIYFTNYHKHLPALFVIYAYFECLTVPISGKPANNTEA